jgi:plastocyanin
MRIRIAFVIAAVAAVSLLPPTGALAGTKKVTVGNNFFKPKTVKIQRKSTVKFKWSGGVNHNVTKKSGPGKAFASKTTKKKGVNFKKTFKKQGTYKLFCTIHPDTMNMKVKVN